MVRSGNGTAQFAHIWPTVISTAVALFAVVAGFWSLADPRAEIKDIKSTFLSIREHEEFVQRVKNDLARLESMNTLQDARFQTQLESRQTKSSSDQATLRLEQRINDLRQDMKDAIQERRESTVGRGEFNTFKSEREMRIKQIEKSIEELMNSFHEHAERDSDRFKGTVK